jgi:hypothetical protein
MADTKEKLRRPPKVVRHLARQMRFVRHRNVQAVMADQMATAVGLDMGGPDLGPTGEHRFVTARARHILSRLGASRTVSAMRELVIELVHELQRNTAWSHVRREVPRATRATGRGITRAVKYARSKSTRTRTRTVGGRKRVATRKRPAARPRGAAATRARTTRATRT